VLSCRPFLTLPFLTVVVAIIAGVILLIWRNDSWTELIRQCLTMKILGPESAFIYSPGRSFTAWLIDRRLTCSNYYAFTNSIRARQKDSVFLFDNALASIPGPQTGHLRLAWRRDAKV